MPAVSNFGNVRQRIEQLIASETAAADAGSAQATATRTDYTNRLNNFDPQQFVARANSAFMANEGEQFEQSETGRRQMLARRGIFGADLGGGAARRDLNTRIARGVDENAFRGAALEQGNLQQFGQLYASDRAYADHSRDRAIDLTMSDNELLLQEEERKRAEKASRWGFLAKAAGGVIGSVLGPVGSAIGTKIAGSLVKK